MPIPSLVPSPSTAPTNRAGDASASSPHREPPLLRVRHVTVRFGGITALDEVTFDIPQGTICALIGPNGAGKTTLLNCLSQIYRCQTGEIRLAGAVLNGRRGHEIARLGVARTFQHLALFRSMTVRENVLLGMHCRERGGFVASALRLRSVRREECAAANTVIEILDLLGLADLAERSVSVLPFGTQKRVELARALASQPRLLLLDEPACGLNHEEVAALGRLVQAVRDRFRLTVLLVEHHMGLVMGISDRVVVLNFGRKIAEGTPGEIRRNPAVMSAYLGDLPT